MYSNVIHTFINLIKTIKVCTMAYIKDRDICEKRSHIKHEPHQNSKVRRGSKLLSFASRLLNCEGDAPLSPAAGSFTVIYYYNCLSQYTGINCH